ncbi:MAG: hypothetical protein U9O82_06150, partial [Thermodesulfobacteriota bacterium]|nr:hypothetical protein [Thermodesulfobacteriota bacterium]
SSLCIDVFCTDKQVCPCHPSGSYKKWCKAFLPQIRYNQEFFKKNTSWYIIIHVANEQRDA